MISVPMTVYILATVFFGAFWIVMEFYGGYEWVMQKWFPNRKAARQREWEAREYVRDFMENLQVPDPVVEVSLPIALKRKLDL